MPKLCQRGIDSAKEKFKVYPSAYANAYASKVCRGIVKDKYGNIKADKEYLSKLTGKGDLTRWFKEKWVNVCEKESKGNYKTCGRSHAKLNPKTYPYCRPLHRINKHTPKTVKELSKSDIKKLCSIKRSKRQGIHKKPTYIRIKNYSFINKYPKKYTKLTNKSQRKSQSKHKSRRKSKRNSKHKSRSKKRSRSFRSRGVQKSFKWITLSTANKYKKYAKERNVSKVARGEQKSNQTALGFMQAYNIAKGNKNIMRNFSVKKTKPGNVNGDQTWADRRKAFCIRHTAQQKTQNDPPIEEKGKYKGLPTRRETGKIMWACSSLSESKLKSLIKKFN